MAYQQKSLRVLTGSLNLLPPGDKIPASDGLAMQNLRADQTGALRSRAGINWFGGNLQFGASPSSQVHTLARWGDELFAGCGTTLYQYGGANTAITSLLSGRPCGIATMNGYAWLMDQGVQGRIKDQTLTNWGITPPASAPTMIGLGDSLIPTGGNNLDPNGFSGTYTCYVTFAYADTSESNPSPESAPTTVTLDDLEFSAIPISADPSVVARNIYLSGGTLGQPYLIGTVNDNTTTTFTTDTTGLLGLVANTSVLAYNDLNATEIGIALEFNHDGPPAALAVVGPYFGRLLAFNSVANPNRMWWTQPGLPEYWPGAALDTGQWVDVGDDGEEILAITLKARYAVIYKARSIWRLEGDPDSGTLERVTPVYGIAGPRAVADAGALDYFYAATTAASVGVMSFDGQNATKVSQKLDPLLQGAQVHLGNDLYALPPNLALSGQIAMEFCQGRLFVSYAEATGPGNDVTLEASIDTGNWTTLRMPAPASNLHGGFTVMKNYGGELYGGSGNNVFFLDQTQGDGPNGFEDYAEFGIPIYYQSRYEDCGMPDNPKVFTDLVIEHETGGDAGTVILLYDNGQATDSAYTQAIGSISSTARTKTTFALGAAGFEDITAGFFPAGPFEVTNLSVRLEFLASHQIVIHAIYLYYYVEARNSASIATIPFELGPSGKVVQVKELQIDLENPGTQVVVELSSDLPGNAIALRNDQTIATGGRRPTMLILPQTEASFIEGRLWQLALACLSGGAGDSGITFRVYAARALTRVIGVYIEGYEASHGFIWDSTEHDFASGLTHIPRGYLIALYQNPIKRARNIEIQIQTAGPVLVTFYSDLPGEFMVLRAQFTVDTSGGVGRRVVRLPLPQGTYTPIEGRMFQIKISGSSQFKLYEASVEFLPVGVYVEAYEASGGATFDTREQDFGTPGVKEARELELDIETTGAITVQLFSDQPGGVMVQCFTTTVTTTGRQQLMLPLVNSQVSPQIEGRMFRVLLSGQNAIRVYGVRLRVRPFGEYLTADEGTAGAFWDSTELDLGAENVKQIREVEFDLWAYGPATYCIYSDLPGNDGSSAYSTYSELPGNVMQLAITGTIPATGGRRKWRVPLPQGSIPDDYLYGRLLRVTLQSAQAVKLFGARAHVRPLGVYVETYEAAAGACWDSLPIDLGGTDRIHDEVRFECSSDGVLNAAIYVDLPGETMSLAASVVVTAGGTSRHWATCPLPPAVEGRTIRIVLTSNQGFGLYKAQVRARSIGRYIAANITGGNNDGYNTLDFDWGSERVKLFKKIELDVQTNGAQTVTVYTDVPAGSPAQVWTQTINTGGLRQTMKVYLPMNVRGRLMRIGISGASAGRVYKLRAWHRPVNEPGAKWEWAEYPLEDSKVVPEWQDIPVPETPQQFSWADLPVKPTAPEWSWASLPVAPTGVPNDPAQWLWGKVLSVEGTPDTWTWVDIPGVSGLDVTAG